MSRILLTGGAGFIGSNTAERLLALGHAVTVLDLFDDFYDPAVKRRNVARALGQPGYRLVEGDIRDPSLMAELVRGEEGPVDAIVHLAARAGVRPSLANPQLYYDVNVRGLLTILEAACLAGVPRLVAASSSSVYGNHPDVPFREDVPLGRPISPYASTKLACEHMAHTFHHVYGIEVVNLRFFTAYGPRQRPEMAIHKFTRLIEAGEEVVLFGRGSRRDYTYIDDVVEGVVAALDAPVTYDTFNLGNSRMVALEELVETLERALGVRARIRRDPSQPGDVDLTCADLRRSREVLGFEPKVPFEEGIERFVAWYRATVSA